MTRPVVRAALALPARSTASNGRRPGSPSRHGLVHCRSVAAAPSNPAFVTLRLVAGAMVTTLALLAPRALPAQSGLGLGGTVTPYAGYLVTGDWYRGPVGTSISAANTPMVGAQLSIPLLAGLSLTGNLGYASSNVQVGVPLLGNLNTGRYSMWMYDAGLELGGLPRGGRGLAPFVQAGLGGMTNTAELSILQVQATNLMYTAGVGADVGLSRNLGLRLQARNYMGRFDSQEAIGIANRGTLTHNWALSAGLKLAF